MIRVLKSAHGVVVFATRFSQVVKVTYRAVNNHPSDPTMATVDLTQCEPSQRKAYQRMSGAGKGDAIRNVWSKDFRHNYDLIFKKNRASRRRPYYKLVK